MFYETVDLMTARKKAKEAETTSDLNDDDSKKRKTKKPIQVIEPDTSSSEEWALDMFKIGTVKKHLKLPSETSIENYIKVRLKHAPQQLKTSFMKKLNSSSNKDNL
ncbi:hypothetical protein ACJJTC_018523 [Scirpophaga incertulas]